MDSGASRSAFTLSELLVGIGIIAVIIGLTLPAVHRVRDASLRMHCSNNLRQIGQALHQYHDTHHVFPPGCSYRNGVDPYPHMTWMTRLLPFLEQETLWQQALQAFQVEPFFEKSPHLLILGHVLPVFTCPADNRTASPWSYSTFQVAFTSFLGVEGIDRTSLDGVLYLDSHVRLSDIRDGTSNTLAVGERPPSANHNLGWWYAGWGQKKDGSADSVLGVQELNMASTYFGICPEGPYEFGPGRLDNNCDAFHFWSTHVGGANFLFADHSVHFVRYSAASVLPALATRAGGEAISLPD